MTARLVITPAQVVLYDGPRVDKRGRRGCPRAWWYAEVGGRRPAKHHLGEIAERVGDEIAAHVMAGEEFSVSSFGAVAKTAARFIRPGPNAMRSFGEEFWLDIPGFDAPVAGAAGYIDANKPRLITRVVRVVPSFADLGERDEIQHDWEALLNAIVARRMFQPVECHYEPIYTACGVIFVLPSWDAPGVLHEVLVDRAALDRAWARLREVVRSMLLDAAEEAPEAVACDPTGQACVSPRPCPHRSYCTGGRTSVAPGDTNLPYEVL